MQAYVTLVCNGSRAVMYQSAQKHPKKEFELVTQWDHPESREKGIDLMTDRQGHYQAHMTHTARGAYEAHMGPRKQEKDQFARILVNYLEDCQKHDSLDHVTIIAPAHFWGLMEKHLSKRMSSIIDEVIQKDYTSLSQKEIKAVLQ